MVSKELNIGKSANFLAMASSKKIPDGENSHRHGKCVC